MRIAYVCLDAAVPVYGRRGASVRVQGVIAALLRAGHQVDLFCARVGSDAPQWEANVPVHRIVAESDDRGGESQRFAAVNEALMNALHHAGPFDAVYERYSQWNEAGMQFARTFRIPGILEVNASVVEERATEHRDIAARVAASVFAAASSIVAGSHEVAAYVNRVANGRTNALVETHGFDAMRFPSVESAPARPFTLGFLGTFQPWHGMDGVTDVFAGVRAAVPDARLLLVGEGPEREAVQGKLSATHHYRAFEFAGVVSPRYLAPWLMQMDVALALHAHDAPHHLSSHTIIEYMAAGVPVVATRSGRTSVLVSHGKTGLLVPPDDVGACVAACLQLHARPAQRWDMGIAGRTVAMSTYTWDAVVDRILNGAGLGARRRLGGTAPPDEASGTAAAMPTT